MTKIIVSSVDSQVGFASVTFHDTITANGDKQWVDSYGIIKTNRDTISEDVVIPSGSNGLSSGPVTIASGYTVTVNGEWAIV